MEKEAAIYQAHAMCPSQTGFFMDMVSRLDFNGFQRGQYKHKIDCARFP